VRGAGKPHKSGLGSQLMQRVNGGAKAQQGGAIGQYAHLFTTDLGDGHGAQLQSVLDMTDLDEMMAMAELAGRSFAAERQSATFVVSLGGESADKDRAERDAARRAAQAAEAGRLTVPRRPPWSKEMEADALDAREREAFLLWRRDLASLEESGGFTVTPFEKNLQVWRQLWRVLERSHLVCQVVDARDPLRYRCADLEAYVEELGALAVQRAGGGAKRVLLLLNKADLLPEALRAAWAQHFARLGVDCIFWSALAATEERVDEVGKGVTALPPTPPAPPPPGVTRTGARVVGREELLMLLEARAAAAAAEGGSDVRMPASGEPRRVVVGLVGYPNVGKSSTLNALVGSKRAGVGATPGKTKHFQTFNMSDSLMLADCPGLVFPSFTDGRAELVAAGVLPIDRLTDVIAPIDVIAARVPRAQLERVYALTLPKPALHEPQARRCTGRELLRAYAASRGLTAGAGLPDETRAGRALLKDYTSGKLLFCEWPPGVEPPPAEGEGGAALAAPGDELERQVEREVEREEEDEDEFECGSDEQWSSEGEEEASEAPPAQEAPSPDQKQAPPRAPRRPPSSAGTIGVGDALLSELRAMGLAGGGRERGGGVLRAEHKMQKKGKKEKMRRLARGPAAAEGVGGALITGKRGGLMPAREQVARVAELLPSLMRSGAGHTHGGRQNATSSARADSVMGYAASQKG